MSEKDLENETNKTNEDDANENDVSVVEVELRLEGLAADVIMDKAQDLGIEIDALMVIIMEEITTNTGMLDALVDRD